MVWEILKVLRRIIALQKKEALAIVIAIDKYRLYLLGRKFTVVTDHQALKWLLSIKDPIGNLTQWSLKLQQYDFFIKDNSGVQHGQCPSIITENIWFFNYTVTVPNKKYEEDIWTSHQKEPELVDLIKYLECGILPSNKRRVKRFSKWNNIHCLKNEVFHYEFLQQMWANPQFPTDLVTFTEEILHGKLHFLCSDYYLVSNRLLNCVTPTKKGDQAQLVVPQDTRSMLIQWHHDHTASGHFGLSKTYEKFR